MGASSPFTIQEHIVPCHHIREDVVRTSLDDGADWRMSVKQYTPLDNLSQGEGDLTILAAPCLGFPKELYEPLWEELHHVLQDKGVRIKSIWIADPAQLGTSAALNPNSSHDYVNPANYTRDLFNMITQFKHHFTHPVIAIGHSIGGLELIQLSLIHPTLFTSLILLDPVLVSNPADGNAFALPAFTLKRPQILPSRDIARIGFSNAFKRWDPRVLDLFMEYGLRDRENNDRKGEVEMVVGRYPELSGYIRTPHMQGRDESTLSKDMDDIEWTRQIIRVYASMKTIAPSTLILAGGNSVTSRKEVREDWEKNYGSNDDFRNPGLKRNVVVDVIENGSHFFPFDDPKDVASRTGKWIESMVDENSVFAKEKKSVREWRALKFEEKEQYIEGWMGEQKVKLFSAMKKHKKSKL